MKKLLSIFLIAFVGLAFLSNKDSYAQTTCDVVLEVSIDYWYFEGYYQVYDQNYNVILSWQTFSNSYQTRTHTLPALTDGSTYLVYLYDSYGDGGISGTVTENGNLLTSWSGYSYSQWGYNYFDVVCSGPAIPNDDCDGAEPISCGQTIAGSTTDATEDYALYCNTSNTAPGIWYSFTGNGDCINLTTCNPSTNYDTKLSVYTGDCVSGLVCVAGNDDDFSCSSSIYFSTVDFQTVVGEEYLVLVHGWSANTGDFELSLSCSPGPINDDVCNATPLTLGVATTADNYCSSAQSGEISPGPGTGISTCNSNDGWCSFETNVQTSVWYTFQAPAGGCVSISAGPIDYQLAVYDVGSCGDFTSYTKMAANDDGGLGFAPYIDQLSCLEPGKTYYIQLDGYNGTQGAGTILVEDCGNAPLTADAGACQTNFDGWDGVDQYNYLTGSGSGGFPGYSYSWSPTSSIVSGANSQTATVDPSVPTTYTLTVTDSKGCTATSTVFVDVVNVDCSNNGNAKKVEVCHVPPGNPANAHVICISENAVGTHLDEHTDNLGYCGNPCLTTNDPPPPCTDVNISITTDFFGSETSWELVNVTTGSTIESVGNTLSSSTTYTYSYCLDLSQCYEFRIYDSYGDGICCFWGAGGYSITLGGTVVGSPTGGAFGFSETVEIGDCNNQVLRLAADEEQIISTDITTDLASLTAYPNPLENTASFDFILPETDNATLKVVNIKGDKIGVLYSGIAEGGESHKVTFDATELPSGIYFVQLITSTEFIKEKIVIIK